MENITNQVIELASGQKFYIVRQALYKGTTYYLAAKVTADEEDFTNEVAFLEKKEENGKEYVKVVEDKNVLSVLLNNISLEEE